MVLTPAGRDPAARPARPENVPVLEVNLRTSGTAIPPFPVLTALFGNCRFRHIRIRHFQKWHNRKPTGKGVSRGGGASPVRKLTFGSASKGSRKRVWPDFPVWALANALVRQVMDSDKQLIEGSGEVLFNRPGGRTRHALGLPGNPRQVAGATSASAARFARLSASSSRRSMVRMVESMRKPVTL